MDKELIIFIISFILALLWNWKGFKNKSRSSWGTPGYVFATYATLFCTILIFSILLFIESKL